MISKLSQSFSGNKNLEKVPLHCIMSNTEIHAVILGLLERTISNLN